MISSISTNQIKYVLALEKTGSFSEAADLCFVTQSTLSIMIKKLENQCNLILFDRKSKPITLTKEGEELINQLKLIYQEFEVLQEIIQGTNQEFYGNLRIGIIPTLAPFLLPLFLNKLVTNYPNINFSIDEITTQEITKRIKTRELDIGILSLPIEDQELIQTSLFNESFLIYDASGTFSRNKKYKIKDIDVSRLWLLEESHCLSSQIEKICLLKKMDTSKHNLEFKSGSILSLLELVNMNKGLTLLPKLATLQKNLIKPSYIFNLVNPIPAREIGIITHPNFSKKRLLDILEIEIKKSVKPLLDKTKRIQLINPY